MLSPAMLIVSTGWARASDAHVASEAPTTVENQLPRMLLYHCPRFLITSGVCGPVKPRLLPPAKKASRSQRITSLKFSDPTGSQVLKCRVSGERHSCHPSSY